MLCSAVIDNHLEDKHPLNFPDASPEERKDAGSRKVARSSSSKYTGVGRRKRDINWRARITLRDKEGRSKEIGCGIYEDERDAALAYDRHTPARCPCCEAAGCLVP